jgi:hypothetical protein
MEKKNAFFEQVVADLKTVDAAIEKALSLQK